MKRYTSIILAAAALIAAGCRDNPVANPIDAPTVDQLNGPLSPPTLQFLVTGVLAQDRLSVNANAYAIFSGIFARNVYRIDASEPRYVSETLGGAPDPGGFVGSGGFAGYYTAMRAANTLILALANAPAAVFSTDEVRVTRGFLRTMKAIDYWRVIEMRDTVGIPIQIDDINAITPIRCKTAVLAYIASLLDSANVDLVAADPATTVPFKLPSGFTSFGRNYSTAANLIIFNRAWKGKVDFYRGMDHQSPQPALFPTAIAELTQALGGAAPGAVPASTFTTGAYYVFVPGGAENTPNIISDSKIGLNPLVKDSVQLLDTRASKIVSRPTTSGGGVTTSITYVGAVASVTNQAAPLAIMRDEELVLLRAQAEIEAGQLANAILDINSVRTHYGLAALALPPDKTTAINELLYEKRYSLLFEGPQRFVDLIAYGRLNATFLRPEVPGDPFNSSLPIPRAELNARGLSNNPACTP